jgi:hypothetical protein
LYLFVLTPFTISNRAAASITDNVTGIIALLLALSCMLSFISIRTSRAIKRERAESIGEYFFLHPLQVASSYDVIQEGRGML